MTTTTKTITIVNDGGVYDISCKDEFRTLLAVLRATYLEHVETKRRVLGYLSLQDGGKYIANLITTTDDGDDDNDDAIQASVITPKRPFEEEEPRELPSPQKLKLLPDSNTTGAIDGIPNHHHDVVALTKETEKDHDRPISDVITEEQTHSKDAPPPQDPSNKEETIQDANHGNAKNDQNQSKEEPSTALANLSASSSSSTEEPKNIHPDEKEGIQPNDAAILHSPAKDNAEINIQTEPSEPPPNLDQPAAAFDNDSSNNSIRANGEDVALLMSLRHDCANDENQSPNQAIDQQRPLPAAPASMETDRIDTKEEGRHSNKKKRIQKSSTTATSSPNRIPRPNEWTSSSPARPKRQRLVLDPPEQDCESSSTYKPQVANNKGFFTLSEYLVEAKALLEKHKYRPAVLLYEKAFPLQIAALGSSSSSSSHLSVAQTCFQMGRALRHLNLFPKSMQRHQQALDIRKRVLPKLDSRIADSYNAIAAVYHDQGQYEMAMASYQQALEIRLEIFGGCHNSVAQVWFNMGWISQKQTHWHEARTAYQKALSIYLKTHAEDHKIVQTTRHQIAQVNGKLNMMVL